MPKQVKEKTVEELTDTLANVDEAAKAATASLSAVLEKATDVPPNVVKRNEFGLVVGEKYVFNEDGTINWRKMISSEFLVPNKQIFQRRGKQTPSSTEGLEDSELLILLGGIKKLAQLRGYCGVRYQIKVPTNDYVVAVCTVDWIPNYETAGCEERLVTFSAIGDAHERNTNGFGKNYLGPIAENRAFVRAVRNFLKINIVSQEEIGGPNNNEGGDDLALSKLRETMTEFGVTFDLIKKKLVEQKVDGADTFSSIEDIPRYKQFELIERIRTKAAEKAAKPQ
jgi:hypothetical protein